jgi:hypothetical protein
MADLILGWNIMIVHNKILAIHIDRCTNVLNDMYTNDNVVDKVRSEYSLYGCIFV